jgi:hypothetical protein
MKLAIQFRSDCCMKFSNGPAGLEPLSDELAIAPTIVLQLMMYRLSTCVGFVEGHGLPCTYPCIANPHPALNLARH